MNSSFPKLFAIGTGYIESLFDGPVEITEKLDGSQFGFGKTSDGQLFCRSKGKVQDLDAPDKMFELGVAYVRTIADRLPNGVTFYGEYLSKPKHSTLAYDRIPLNHIALFGIKLQDETFVANYADVKSWADKLNLEAVPLLYSGTVTSTEELLKYLDTTSFLGGQKIEGFVAKRYVPWMFGPIIMPLMGGKYVSEQFKEVHSRDWASDNTAKGGLEKLKAAYKTPARWMKAVQHLEEAGVLTRTVKDIGPLMKEVKADIVAEEKEEIKSGLYHLFIDDVLRNATSGLPEWWKRELAESSFKVDPAIGWTGDQGLEQPSA